MASSTPTADSDVWVGSVFGLKFGFHALQQRRVTVKKVFDILDRFRRCGFQNVYDVCSTEGRPALPEEVEW